MFYKKKSNIIDTENKEAFPIVSDTSIILGNGPTLNEHTEDIERIYYKENAIIFGVNRIYRGSFDFPIHYYCALDKHLWRFEHSNLHNLRCHRYFIQDRYLETGKKNLHRIYSFSCASDPFSFANKISDGFGHGYNTVYVCMQLAAISGVKKIDIFGVDFSNDSSGKSHFYGNAHRTKRSWELGKKAIFEGIKKLNDLDINCAVHSELFWGEK